LPDKDSVQIAPAEGKLGVLVPGMGAVTTPVGSLTQPRFDSGRPAGAP
jgi:hypothetical protein